MCRDHLDALISLATLIAGLENDSHLESQAQLKERSFIKWLMCINYLISIVDDFMYHVSCVQGFTMKLLLLFPVSWKIGSVGVLEGIL